MAAQAHPGGVKRGALRADRAARCWKRLNSLQAFDRTGERATRGAASRATGGAVSRAQRTPAAETNASSASSFVHDHQRFIKSATLVATSMSSIMASMGVMARGVRARRKAARGRRRGFLCLRVIERGWLRVWQAPIALALSASSARASVCSRRAARGYALRPLLALPRLCSAALVARLFACF